MNDLLKEAGKLLVEINNDLAKKQTTENLTEKELDRKAKCQDLITRIRETGIVDDSELLT